MMTKKEFVRSIQSLADQQRECWIEALWLRVLRDRNKVIENGAEAEDMPQLMADVINNAMCETLAFNEFLSGNPDVEAVTR